MKLYPNQYYHIYNHANGRDNLFYEEVNYERFLASLQSFILPFADIHAYCLMPNHFHLLVQIHSEEKLAEALMEKLTLMDLINYDFKHKDRLKTHILKPELVVPKRFADLFNGYAQYLNKHQERKGNLFMRGFKAKLIEDNDYLKRLLRYIHRNPINHRFASSLVEWPWTSYQDYLSSITLKYNDMPLFDLFEDHLDFYLWHSE